MNNGIENSGELTSVNVLICCHYSMLTTSCKNMEDYEFVLKNPISYLIFSSAALVKKKKNEEKKRRDKSTESENCGGHSPAPIKKTMKAIAKKALVILIYEYKTSTTCSSPLDNVYRSDDFKYEHK
ncbi:hypothetical protein K501DRAFT_276145 [Backusella circina FSU 941]|nr:hypothetical protein K501DRAFT_276145 [Backusella circina FSU 941]